MIARRLSAKTLRGESARYERPRSEREAAILQAATAIFGAKGYRGARTADAAQEGLAQIHQIGNALVDDRDLLVEDAACPHVA